MILSNTKANRPAGWFHTSFMLVLVALLLPAELLAQNPETTSITRFLPTSSTTSSSALEFRADFNSNVLFVDPSDFALSGTIADSCAITDVVALAGDAYVVVVNNSSSVSGTLGLDINGVDGAGSNNIEEDLSAIDQQSLADIQVTNSPEFGQSFVAGASGPLVKVVVQTGIGHSYSGPGTMELITGDGFGGAVLATESISVHSSIGEKTYFFTNPATVSSGSTYTLRFNFPGGSSSNIAFSAQVGAGYGSGLLYQPAALSSADLYFKTYVQGPGALALSSTTPTTDETFQFVVCDLTASGAQTQAAVCDGGSGGVAAVSASSSNGGLSYSWPTGDTTASASNLAAGTYSVLVTDVFQCSATATAVVAAECDMVVLGNGNDVAFGATTATLTNGTDFGGHNAGDTASQVFYIYNHGSTTLQLTNPITFSGANAANFFVLSPPADSIAAGDSTAFTLGFSASTFIAASATVSIANNGMYSNPFSFAVAGAVAHNGFHFDGLNDIIEAADATSLDVDTAFTIETWINPAYLSTSGIVTKFGNGSSNRAFALLLLSNGGLEFSLSTNGSSEIYVGSSGTIPAGQWSHVAATYDGSTMRLFINGVQDANTQSASGSVFDSSKPMLMGARDNGSVDLHFEGILDEVRLWKVARTPQELIDHKNCQLNGNENGLAAYYNFNQSIAAGNNSGAPQAVDVSGNGNTGQIAFAGLTGSTSNFIIGALDSVGGACTLPLSVVAVTDSNANCAGELSGGITATASDGAAPYTYLWSNSATTASITGIVAGIYTVTVSDAVGGTATASAMVTEPAMFGVSVLVDSLDQCGPTNTGGISATTTGGVAPYTYGWGNGATTASITGLAAGSYSLSVVDSTGCWAYALTTVETACEAPTVLKEWNIQDTMVTLRWDTVCGATSYLIRYRPTSSGTWTTIVKQNNKGVRSILGLMPNTNYRWTVSTNCGNGWSAPSAPRQFSTLQAPCPPPSNLSTTLVQDSKARLSWTVEPTAKKYRIRWRVQGTGSWNVVAKDGFRSKHWLTGLAAATTYEWGIKTQCGKSSATPWSATQQFTTDSVAKAADFAAQASAEALSLTVFPNPTTGLVQVQISNATAGTLSVVDVTGRTVHAQPVTGSKQLALDLSEQSSGLYFVQLRTTNGFQTVKLLVK